MRQVELRQQAGLPEYADTYIKNDVLSIEESIVNHVEYTMARSRYKFDDQEAYMATAYSLRDRLIESWNDTQAWFKCAAAIPRACTAVTIPCFGAKLFVCRALYPSCTLPQSNR